MDCASTALGGLKLTGGQSAQGIQSADQTPPSMHTVTNIYLPRWPVSQAPTGGHQAGLSGAEQTAGLPCFCFLIWKVELMVQF